MYFCLLNLKKHPGGFETEGSKTAQLGQLFFKGLSHTPPPPPSQVLATPRKPAANEIDQHLEPNYTYFHKETDSQPYIEID